MLRFLHKNLLKNTVTDSLKAPQLCSLSPRYLSVDVRSKSVEKRIESVFSVFKAYGFTDSQISTLINGTPSLLSLNLEKSLKPKLEFFISFGFSQSDLQQIVTRDPEILRRNLDNQLMTNCNFLKSVLKDKESIVVTVKRSTWVLKNDLRKHVGPNIDLLRDYGVRESSISALLRTQPRLLMQTTDRFKSVVEEVKEMGFEPTKTHFVGAVEALSGMSESKRKQKWELYRKWGWSDDEILLAFRRQPNCILVSEEKVERMMDFLIKKMGWGVSQIVVCPAAVMHSPENWTIPRCLVVQFLLSKGVLKKNVTLSSFISLLERVFFEKFVDSYRAQFPEVLDLYRRPADDIQISKISTSGETILEPETGKSTLAPIG